MNQLVTEARALCERATKGPWTLIKEGRYEDHDECRIDLPDDNIELCRYENGELVARSRTLLPEMADEIERLEAELDALKADIEAGRLVRLPCAVGDKVFIITERYLDCENCPHSAEAKYDVRFGRVCCDLEDCHCPREVEARLVTGLNVDANGASAPGEWGFEGLETFAGVDGKWYKTEAEALDAMKEDAHAQKRCLEMDQCERAVAARRTDGDR